jgi:hypothetical protein
VVLFSAYYCLWQATPVMPLTTKIIASRQKRSRALSSSPLVIAAAKQAHMFEKKHVWEEVAILAAARFDSTSCKLGFEGDGK